MGSGGYVQPAGKENSKMLQNHLASTNQKEGGRGELGKAWKKKGKRANIKH